MADRPDPLPADVSLGTTFLVLACILTFFSLLMTGVRVWVRKANGVIGWDDYTCKKPYYMAANFKCSPLLMDRVELQSKLLSDLTKLTGEFNSGYSVRYIAVQTRGAN